MRKNETEGKCEWRRQVYTTIFSFSFLTIFFFATSFLLANFQRRCFYATFGKCKSNRNAFYRLDLNISIHTYIPKKHITCAKDTLTYTTTDKTEKEENSLSVVQKNKRQVFFLRYTLWKMGVCLFLNFPFQLILDHDWRKITRKNVYLHNAPIYIFKLFQLAALNTFIFLFRIRAWC